ncbi:hypothetical protein IZY60_12200 [Lutibacter sp. B2]|nr:hypothetical protein [Lutibacter sp. B2]
MKIEGNTYNVLKIGNTNNNVNDLGSSQFKEGSIQQNIKEIEMQVMEEMMSSKEGNFEGKILDLLKKLEINPQKEIIILVKKLMNNKMPITKANIISILNAKYSFEQLEELLDNVFMNLSDEEFEMDIKTLFRKLLKESSQSDDCIHDKEEMDEVDEKVTQKKNNLKQIPNKKESQIFNKKGDTTSFEANTKVEHTELNRMNNKMNINKEDTEKVNINKENNSNVNKDKVSVDKINIDKMDFDKIIFMLQHKMKVNLMNATNINNIINKDNTLTDQFNSLLKLLDDSGVDLEIIKELKNIHMELKDSKKVKLPIAENLKKIYSTLNSIETFLESVNNTKKGTITNEIVNLKSSLDFINKINQFQTYFQMPVMINNEMKNLELFIEHKKNKKKKLNPKDIRIFIALDTNNLDYVHALIEIKDKDITCNFRFVTDDAKLIVKKYEKILMDALKKYDFQRVNLNYVVSQDKMSILNIESNDANSTLYSIDLKV